LKGHERSITQVKYNLDGDLLFTSAKDQKPTVWYADTGERIGTYGTQPIFIPQSSSSFMNAIGFHKGAVWDLDPSWDSQYLVTACADGSARLFETCTGKYICKMPHRGSVFSSPSLIDCHLFLSL
jgi:translation initiation factor 3 subunit I